MEKKVGPESVWCEFNAGHKVFTCFLVCIFFNCLLNTN
jgi:hypothetical protein